MSENGRLRQGAGGHPGGDRRRSVTYSLRVRRSVIVANRAPLARAPSERVGRPVRDSGKRRLVARISSGASVRVILINAEVEQF